MISLQADLKRNQLLLGAVLWAAFLAVNNIVNALSVLTERMRIGLPVDTWEPFVWELSSGIGTLLLAPLVAAVVQRFPVTPANWQRAVWLHLAATFPFCGLHVLGMVALRKAAYGFAGQSYDFGDVPAEFLYEWRKDAITYFLIVAVLHVWRWRLAKRSTTERSTVTADADIRFHVKSKGRQLTVPADSIDWIEAAGNYVILHTASGQHMLRETLKAALARLDPDLFIRVHRSAAINSSRLVGIDARTQQVQLLNGDSVPVARACWSALATKLSARNALTVHP